MKKKRLNLDEAVRNMQAKASQEAKEHFEALKVAIANPYGESSLAQKPVVFLTPKSDKPVTRDLGDNRVMLASGCYYKRAAKPAP